MALPTLAVKVGFASDPFAASISWTTLPATDVLGLSIRKGRNHALDRIEAGEAIIYLKNASGDYYPDNSGGTYSPNVKPGKAITVVATYDSTAYSIFYGFIEALTPSWVGKGGKGPVITLRCADVMKNLARLLLNDGTGYSQEVSGTRIDNVLDDLSANIGRDLDTGQSTVKATGALANVNAMSHLQTVQLSEAGYMFVAGDGDVQFHDRHARLKSPYTTSQATFGDDGGEMFYANVSLSSDDEMIMNDIRLTRDGGAEQVVSDATSQGDYGQRSLSRTGLLVTTDAEMLSQAQYFLKRYKDPAMRATSITVHADRDADNLYPKVLGYDIGTRITLRLNQASIDKEYHIESVHHTVDAKERRWATKWQLSDASDQVYWALGVAGLSELGETTWLAY